MLYHHIDLRLAQRARAGIPAAPGHQVSGPPNPPCPTNPFPAGLSASLEQARGHLETLRRQIAALPEPERAALLPTLEAVQAAHDRLQVAAEPGLKQAEEALRQSEERLRAIFASAQDAIYM